MIWRLANSIYFITWVAALFSVIIGLCQMNVLDALMGLAIAAVFFISGWIFRFILTGETRKDIDYLYDDCNR